MSWQEVTIGSLILAATPIVWILRLVIYILHWTIWPFLLIASAIKSAALIPLHFLAQFEALYYFLLTSIVLGTLLGLTLHQTTNLLTSTFNLNYVAPSKATSTPESTPPTGHSPQTYRAARSERKRLDLIKSERHALRARLLVASQPFLSEVAREARGGGSNPNVNVASLETTPTGPGAGVGLEMTNTATAATRAGLFRDIILEQTDEEESEESVF